MKGPLKGRGVREGEKERGGQKGHPSRHQKGDH